MNFLQYIIESQDLNVQLEIENIDNNFINELINNLSFIYKKRKDRYIRPRKITGKMNDSIDIRINMYNKDILLIEYNNNELKITINGDVDYYMDNINKDEIINKIYNRYTKYIENNNYKVIKKIKPF